MAAYFEGPKLKIERANHHIEEFHSTINIFLKTDFYRLHIERNSEGLNVLKLEFSKPLPVEIPLIIGDAIHNLRTALDLMACEIVRAANKTPDKYTKFPFRQTRDELIAAINGGQIQPAGADIINLIV